MSIESLDIMWRHILENIVASIKETTEDQTYISYVNKTRLVDLDDKTATISCSNFIAQQILTNELDLFEKACSDYIGHKIQCKLIIANQYFSVTKEDVKETKILTHADNLNPSFTFDSFVVGQSNRESYYAALTCATNVNNPIFNPVFIYGNSGLGKTHLLNSIGNYLKEHNPEKKILYIPCTEFVNEVVSALREERIDQYKAMLNSLDVLLVDDIQNISNKAKSVEVFFGIYNELFNNHKVIVLSSDRKPDDIKDVESRLISRFNQGLSVTISSPEYETAYEILIRKIKNTSMNPDLISDDVISYIARTFSSDVRKLEGALTRLLFFSINFSKDGVIDLALAMEAFNSTMPQTISKNELEIKDILNAVADYYGLTKTQLISKTRTKNVATARHIAMYLCRKHLDASFVTIGKEFGNRDHTTVSSGCEKIESLLKTNEAYRQVIKDIEKNIS